jgi:hypothetical protein
MLSKTLNALRQLTLLVLSLAKRSLAILVRSSASLGLLLSTAAFLPALTVHTVPTFVPMYNERHQHWHSP